MLKKPFWKKSTSTTVQVPPNAQPEQSQKPWAAILGGIGVMSFGVGILVSGTVKPPALNLGASSSLTSLANRNQVGAPSAIVPSILNQTPQQRAALLKPIAESAQPSLDRNRARYVLATDLLAAGQAQPAIERLKELEKDYPVLAPRVILQRAKALEKLGKTDEALKTYQSLVVQFPQDPATAEALAALAQKDDKYTTQLISQFPSHPATIAIANARLKKNPKQPNLQLLLALHDIEAKNYSDRTDQFIQSSGKNLSPEQWERIAFGYWENQKYDKAAEAYAKAPGSPLTLYRSGRGLHLSGKAGARDRYLLTIKTFPQTPEAGLAMSRLLSLTENAQETVAFADQILASYPDQAPAALLAKAKALDSLHNATAANQARQLLLEKYSDSEPAAELRWTIAQQQAKAKQLAEAIKWADAVIAGNPQSELAPQAGFWAGKWALQSGQSAEASKHFQKVLAERPESYYAWRSASLLGWNVGDFESVRKLTPTIQRPQFRATLPAGSETLRELHQIGHDQTAWSYWQTEFKNRVQPTVAEQFTDGVMRLGVGDNLDGIFMVSHLDERSKPEDKQQVQALKQSASYWQTLYPFPFMQPIETWSKERQLNPMLVTALIRQESRFEPKIQSAVGATGLMQVMPETGSYIASQIKVKNYSLSDPEDSIKFGTWYLDYTHREYQGNTMLAVASYNAGPGAVSGWVSKSKTQDADEFVEAIPFSETKGYVKSVMGNYWNYLRLYNPEIAKQVAQVSSVQPKDLF